MEEVFCSLSPRQILQDPLYNKGTAFTVEERNELGLHGLLPYQVSTLEMQVIRRYQNFLSQTSQMAKFLFLNALHNRNEILFYKLVSEHISEMLPLIYTPTVGDFSLYYSVLYSYERGLFVSYPNKDQMEKLIDQYKERDIEIIVVTDGERILGLGDVGVGGMAIPIGKLSLYTLFGGIHPAKTLPVFLDVGTNNPEFLNDPGYMGWRHERISGTEYDNFVDSFVKALKKRFPKVLLQWEDFSREHARPLLDRYKEEILSFNDDIQGTAAVVLSAILSACYVQGISLKEQKIAVLGAGSAGIGICNQILEAMIEEGLSQEEAYDRFYLVDRSGLLQEGNFFDPNQKPFLQSKEKIEGWRVKQKDHISLLEVIENAKPTVLIGVSTQGGAFTKEIVQTMLSFCKKPLILPLSNPNSCCEAKPQDLIEWGEGRVLFATGSHFSPVEYQDKYYPVAQCNNVYIFPGVGLGVISAQASKITNRMFIAAAKELAAHSPMCKDPKNSLFPSFESLKEISQKIAFKVGLMAIEEGVSSISPIELEKTIRKKVWEPNYPIYKRKR